MAYRELIDGESFGAHRGKINLNTQDLNDLKAEISQVLTKTNTTVYTPTNPYNPAVKLTVDNAVTAIYARIDPQNIGGDAFARANHTGVQGPETITQDENNRFVTDLQITSWNNKEDYIGTKYTAFNKDFGTIAGTVATGDHTHNKADIGLGNVDNTADADKEVSGPQQAALDLKVDIGELITSDYTPQATPPAVLEGRVFYDETNQALSVYTDIPDFLHNLGQEEVIRVVNNSGVTIPNATPVRQTGASGGFPTIAPAIASSLDTSLVQGITTHEIPNGSQGFMTFSGKLGGDFSAFAINDRLFLSDTVAGGYTTTAPDIVTFLGTVMDNGTDGNILAKIRTLVSIPTGLAYLNGATVPTTLTGGTTYPITGYDPAKCGNVVLPYDPTAGTITVPTSGVFRVVINLVLTHDTNNNERIQNLEIYNTTDATVAASIPQSIGRETGSTNISLSYIFNATANKTYQLRLAPTDTFNTVGTDLVSFSLESIHFYVGG